MEIRYPIRKADGQDYKHYDELMTDMQKMAHGLWLVGVNRYWHGGVHVGDTSSPASVLSQETPEKSVPLQCMIDGEVVAWRVCRDYTQALLYENHAEKMELRHSPTFLLVKSVHKPDEQDAASWLTLYHLYMQMAPLSEYPKRKLYRVTEKGHGVRLRQHNSGDDDRELAPDVMTDKRGLAQTLSRGNVLAMLSESSFMLKGNSEPFGLMQKVTDGIPAGPLFWVSMRPEFMAPDGECHVCLPVWMHHALNHGVFDEVVLPPAPLKVAIKAGDAVGFLGAQDISENGYTRESRTEYKAHIELLSTDAHVPDVLANIKGIKSGAQYVKLKLKRPFYLRNGDGDDATFSPMSALTRKDGDMILRRETTHPFTDKAGVVWFQIRPHTWMHQDDVEQLSQHDLTQLNFTAIVAEPTTDFSRPLDESWATEAVKSLASHFDAEKGPDSAQAKTFFDGVLGQLRARNAGGMTEWDSSELNKRLFNVLHSSQMNLPELTRRLVVKHDSDWHGGSENSRWGRLFGDGWEPMNGVNKLFLQKHEWMNKVPPFMEGKPVWHFHPLEFLEAIAIKERCRELFLKISRVILQHEGGYVNDPDDKGGETNMGITIDTWKAYASSDLGIEASSQTLKGMTSEQAEVIYYKRYWEPKGFCKLENTKIALMIYDWTITSGLAVKQIRKMLHNEYNSNLEISNKMNDDMIHCINAAEDQGKLLSRIAEIRKDYYRSLTMTNGVVNSQIKYLSGWLNRVDDCLRVTV